MKGNGLFNNVFDTFLFMVTCHRTYGIDSSDTASDMFMWHQICLYGISYVYVASDMFI